MNIFKSCLDGQLFGYVKAFYIEISDCKSVLIDKCVTLEYNKVKERWIVMDIGSKIKEARIKSQLTQEQVAEALEVSRHTVSNWENGIFHS